MMEFIDITRGWWRDKRAARQARSSGQAYQRRRLDQLLAYVRRHSPYYRELYKNLPERIDDIRRLPPTNKPGLMARFDDVVTDRQVTLKKAKEHIADPADWGRELCGRFLVWTSSGVSGTPGVFVQDTAAVSRYYFQAVRQASGSIPWQNPAYLWRLKRQGIRAALPGLAAGPYAEVVGLKWLVRKRPGLFRGYDPFLPLDSGMDEVVSRLSAIAPQWVFGAPSTLSLLAQEVVSNRLKCHPAVVGLTGEQVTVTEKARIAAAFGSAVRETYSSSEALAIAHECVHGRLHANISTCIIEAVDKDHQPVPPGTASATTLITNLENRILPFIRYDQGDSITVGQVSCPCGDPSPTITVAGRQNDLLSLPDATDGEPRMVLPLAIVTPVLEIVGLRRFQLIQTGPAELEARMEIAIDADRPAIWRETEKRLRSALDRQGVGSVTLRLSDKLPGADQRGRKFRLVYRDF